MKTYMRLFNGVSNKHGEPLKKTDPNGWGADGPYVGPLDGVCAIHGTFRIGTERDDYSDIPFIDGGVVLGAVCYGDIDFVSPREVPKGADKLSYAAFVSLTS
jgi:hypothetical protein